MNYKSLYHQRFKTTHERFWEKVDTSGTCWEWMGGVRRDGYGAFWLNGRTLPAHRVALIIGGAEIPDGMCVCHSCDNPVCVNPKHLFVGTPAENTQDMLKKGRASKRHGSYNPSSKLTEDDVRKIRSSTQKLGEIAKRFGISIATACQVKGRKTWKHVR